MSTFKTVCDYEKTPNPWSGSQKENETNLAKIAEEYHKIAAGKKCINYCRKTEELMNLHKYN